jgi:hypothetical protein
MAAALREMQVKKTSDPLLPLPVGRRSYFGVISIRQGEPNGGEALTWFAGAKKYWEDRGILTFPNVKKNTVTARTP